MPGDRVKRVLQECCKMRGYIATVEAYTHQPQITIATTVRGPFRPPYALEVSRAALTLHQINPLSGMSDYVALSLAT
jgi:hypothetical protein